MIIKKKVNIIMSLIDNLIKKIRKMSDEELKDWIIDNTYCPYLLDKSEIDCKSTCRECWEEDK
jgi:hypothetical protein